MGLNTDTTHSDDKKDVFDQVAEQLIREHASMSSSDTTKQKPKAPLKTQAPLDIVTAYPPESRDRMQRILKEISEDEDRGHVFV